MADSGNSEMVGVNDGIRIAVQTVEQRGGVPFTDAQWLKAMELAILNERERCAKIADDMYYSSRDRSKDIRPTGAGSLGELCLAIGGEATANAIRTAINCGAAQTTQGSATLGTAWEVVLAASMRG